MTPRRRTHAVTVTYDGGAWHAQAAPDISATDRSLSRLETRVRRQLVEQVEGVTDVDALDLTIRTGSEQLDRDIAAARQLREESQQMATRARTAARAPAQQLRDLHISLRDTAQLLGYSRSTIDELTREEAQE